MEIVSTQSIRQAALQHDKQSTLPEEGLVLPSMLRCLMLTWCDERVGLLRTSAESESWYPSISLDVQEYLRSLFRLRVPLTLIDLPSSSSTGYVSIQRAASFASEMGDSQVIVCGNEGLPEEELWARGLGVWAYLPGDGGPAGLQFVFSDARQALAKSAATYVELEAYR